ncbi:MAG TPA: PQQ-binding-like beta-propeller repeat protein [Acidimicrobiia bacterium]|nr:PQQ-binding-like beta-propeller repeat protein [Acidimicrobiia bacterium]
MRRIGLLAFVVFCATSLSGCWLQLGDGPGRRSFVADETTLTNSTVNTLHQAWSVDLGVFPLSSPLVNKGNVYVSGGSTMTALAAKNGAQSWQTDIGTDPDKPTLDQPAFSGERILVPYSIFSFGGTYSFDATTGTFNDNGGTLHVIPYGAPAVTGTTEVYDVAAIQPPSSGGTILHMGSLAGFVSFGSLGSDLTASNPMVSGNRAFVSSQNGVLAFALDSCPSSPAPGLCSPQWTTPLGASGGMPVALSATQLAVPLSNLNVAVLDDATGALQWSASTGSNALQSPAIDGSTMYVGGASSVVKAFPIAGCGMATCSTPTWTSPSVGGAISSQPVVAGGVVYVGTSVGTLVALDASTGAILKTLTVDATANKVFVVEDAGTVYATTNSGVVAAFRP